MPTETTSRSASLPERTSSALPGRARFLPLLSWMGTVLLLYSPVLWRLFRASADSSLYSYIPLIPFVSVFFFWKYRGELNPSSELRWRSAALPSLAAAVFAVAGVWVLSNDDQQLYLSFAALSFVLAVIASATLTLSAASLRKLVFPLGFLLLLVPPPAALVSAFEAFLQHGSALATHLLFVLTNIAFVRDGLTFQIPGVALQIAPQCSGIRSTIVLLITALVGGQMFLKSGWLKALLCALVLPLGMLRNGFRITVLAHMCSVQGPQALDSDLHRSGGPLFFAVFMVPFLVLLLAMKICERKYYIKRNLAFIFLCGALSLFLPACTKESRVARVLAAARQDLKAGKVDHAEIHYMRAIQLDAENPEAVLELGKMLFEQGRIAYALPLLERAVELRPADVNARVRLGLSYLSTRRFPEAAAQAKAALEIAPNDQEAILVLAETAATPSQIKDVRAQIVVLAKDPKAAVVAHLGEGTLLLKEKDLAGAEREFKSALQKDSGSHAALAALGSIYWALDDQQRAAEYLRKASQLAPATSLRRLKYPEFLLKTGQLDEAQTLFRAARKANPGALRPLTAQAEISLLRGNTKEAKALAQQALDRNQSDLEALLVKQKVLYLTGTPEQAAKGAQECLRLYPQSAEAHFQSAIASLKLGDAGAAMRSLNQAILLNPGSQETILLLAELEIRRSNPKQAIALLRNLIQQQPNIAKAHMLLASAYMAAQSWDDAIATYKMIESRLPQQPEWPFFIANAYQQKGMLKEAREAAEKAYALSTNFLPALELLVELDLSQDKISEAQNRVIQALNANPNRAELSLLKARVLVMRKDLVGAENAVLEAIRLNPDYGNSYRMLAEICISSGKPEQALDRMRGYLQKHNDSASWMQLATICHSIGRYDEAKVAYEKVIALRPKFAPALNNLASLLAEHFKDLESAKVYAQRARDAQPTDAYAADTLGWISFQRGDIRRAYTLLVESSAQLPDHPEIAYHAAVVFYTAGYEEQAAAALARALKVVKDPAHRQHMGALQSVLALPADKGSPQDIATITEHLKRYPEDPTALLKLATYEVNRGDKPSAEKILRRLAESQPALHKPAIHLADLLLQDPRKTEEALKYARKANEAAPEDPAASRLLGLLLFRSSDFTSAAHFLSEALKGLPNDSGVAFTLARAQYGIGRINEAVASATLAANMGDANSAGAKTFALLAQAVERGRISGSEKAEAEKALAVDACHCPALMVMATVARNSGDYAGAEQRYRKVIGCYPQFVPAVRQLAILCFEHLGKPQEAQVLATRAREVYAQDAALARLLGIIAFSNKDYSRTAVLLAESARTYSQDATILHHLGMSYYHLRQREQSRGYLEKALALGMPKDLEQEARDALSSINQSF